MVNTCNGIDIGMISEPKLFPDQTCWLLVIKKKKKQTNKSKQPNSVLCINLSNMGLDVHFHCWFFYAGKYRRVLIAG